MFWAFYCAAQATAYTKSNIESTWRAAAIPTILMRCLPSPLRISPLEWYLNFRQHLDPLGICAPL